MFRSRFVRMGLLLVVASVAVYAASAQTGKAAGAAVASSRWAWTDEKWTGDDTLYRSIRAGIDSQVSTNNFSTMTVQKYYTLWKQKPSDPKRLFGWAYASFQAEQLHPPLRQNEVPGTGAFELVPSPRTYEYARIRFLVQARSRYQDRLEQVGERLLMHSPNDYDVEYYLVSCYKPWRSATEKQEALSHAQDLVRKYPNKPSAYAALAGVYDSTWFAHRNHDEGEKAIAAYKRYLQVAPSNYEWRAQVQKRIAYIKEGLNR